VSKAVAEIQFCGMSAAFTEITIGFACNSRLSFGDGFNRDARFFNKLIEAPTGDRIAASVDHQRSFNKVGGRHASVPISLDRECAILRFGFVAKDCDKRRRIDYHRGSPRSSYNSSSWSADRYGSFRRLAQSWPISKRRSARLAPCSRRPRSRRSRTAVVAAADVESPVSFTGYCARGC